MKRIKSLKRFAPFIIVFLILVFTLAMCARSGRTGEPDAGETAEVSETVTPTVTQTASPPPVKTPGPSETPSDTPPEETSYDGPVNPLTGLPCDTDITKNRPMAIMINNKKEAQPQVGISNADIIYEVPVEGGITRMMVVYQDVSGAGVIGSIRSARPYYLDIVQGYDAVYIHAGGSEQAYTVMNNRGITHLDGVNGGRDDIFYRDAERRKKMGYEHSMMTSDELILKYLPKYNLRLEHKDGYESALLFADDGTPAGGQDAMDFAISLSSSKKTSFSYNADDGKYYASQYGKAYTDGGNGEQVAVTNVLVLKTAIGAIDSEGRLAVTLTGSGDGYFICGGKYVSITWSKKDASSQFEYTLEDGSSLEFGRGKTYVCIIPKGMNVDIT